jgi:hypothetical protein
MRLIRLTGVLTTAVLAAAVLVHDSGAARAQQLAQLRAEWGLTFVAFIGRLDVRNPTVPPKEVTVQVGAGRLANPNLIRRPILSFLADGRTPKRAEIELTPRLAVATSSSG